MEEYIKNNKNSRSNKSKIKNKRPNLGAVFDKHVKCEFQDHDVDATMKTMVREPYVHHVPMMTGGIGYDSVYNFYKNHFVGKMPEDTKIERISRTVGKDQVVDELILKFTHSREIDYLLPGVEPTGKYVELPHVVVMKFIGDKIAHEHIYWDQASLLAQIGLLDANSNLPVKGIEQARKLQELATTNRSSTNTTTANHRRTI
jgi:carboxymethylenebutenolidase